MSQYKLIGISIGLSEILADGLEKLVKLGIIKNKSEGMRDAVKKLIEKEKLIQQIIQNLEVHQ